MTTETAEGLLLVDKPAGPTSHDVVDLARRALGTRRIGHTGTLDPFATGLLILLAGRVTRLAEYSSGLTKQYEARLRLGTSTDSDDATGSVISRSDAWRELDPQRVRTALEAHVGDRLQQPPAFSAKKVGGRRSYEATRRGESVSLAPSPVRIDALVVTAVALPDVCFEITCSAGTYIRAVARDTGIALGVPAHLASLRRTAIGPFRVEEAIRLADVTRERARAALQPALAALPHLPDLDIEPRDARVLMQGGRVPLPSGTGPTGGLAAITSGHRLLAVAEIRDGWIVPRKVLADG